MLFKLESKPKHSNCPRCQSTDIFLSIYNDSRYCINCDNKYDRADEVRLREQTMDEVHWAV
jgi:uncharacterized protein (DUF983 family)